MIKYKENVKALNPTAYCHYSMKGYTILQPIGEPLSNTQSTARGAWMDAYYKNNKEADPQPVFLVKK